MNRELLKTRQQIADEIGVSYRTLRRRIKTSSLRINGNLIPPNKAKQIRALFGLTKADFDRNRVRQNA